MTLPWQPHTEAPSSLPATALIALQDDLGKWFIRGVFYMTASTDGKWYDEQTDKPLARIEYMWLDETALTDTIPV
jgi:hypothetical protein